MPVCSYIVYPVDGKEALLAEKLNGLQDVEVHRDDAEAFFILVSDTKSQKEEKYIQDELAAMDEIQCTTLSFMGDPEKG